MAHKYIRTGTGASDFQEVEATVESTGAAEAGHIVALDPTGKLDETLLPTGVGADIKQMEATEALSAGDFVNIHDDGGEAKVRKADASSTGREANGFVLTSGTSGNPISVYFTGINDELSGLTPASIYYLSTTAGEVTTTRPTGSGDVVQKIGRALSATEISFETHPTIEVA